MIKKTDKNNLQKGAVNMENVKTKEKVTFVEASDKEVLMAAKRCNKKYKEALQRLSK